jgi:hypothetical protein
VKKYLLIIALLFVVIGTPCAHATPYTPTFTCDGGFCTGGTPTAPDVMFPAPTFIIETWNGVTDTIALAGADSPGDVYNWANISVDPTTTLFEIINQANGNTDGFLDITQSAATPFIQDSGTLTFAPAGSGVTPEPATWIYAITAVLLGLLLTKLKVL